MGGAGAWRRPRYIAAGLALAGSAALGALIAWEWHSSTLQAKLLSAWARELSFEWRAGPAQGNRYPQAGPFDQRMGYARIPQFVERLQERGYQVSGQAQQSAAMIRFGERGFFLPYHEKTQTGLVVRDCRADPLFSSQFPQRVYADYDDIPPLLAETLAFIENRELLTATAPRHNPALEWPRLGRALLDQAISVVDRDHPAAGGSTLATQLEKFRHSPEGRTASVGEKYRQLVSASVRAYMDGEFTAPARRRILLNYLNSLPLGAQRGHGEVIGILDGLRTWYGTEVVAANELLRASAGGAQLADQARVYRQVVSLLIAQRRPSYYLGAGQGQLAAMTDSYLRLLAEAGVIGAPLRDAALQARLSVREAFAASAAGTEVSDLKAATLARVQLSSLLDTARLYDLDHLDLAVDSTIDVALQKAVTETLRGLRHPDRAREAGLIGFQLLERGDPSQLVYSFTLYERGEGVNRVRVQTDNLDQPFDINTGAKLELGSTAKLRALTSYLETVAALHAQLSPLDRQALQRREVAQRDRLTRWAVDHLLAARDRSLVAMLEAAMARRYSASPHESFFTGGGVHSFSNFDPRDDGRIMTVAEAFRGSVNLVFIRLMRDIVQHHMYRGPRPVEQILDTPGHPERAQLLARFADLEGSRFLRRFLARYQGQAPARMLAQRVDELAKPTPVRLAVIYRSWSPQAPFEDFAAFLRGQLPAAAAAALDEDELRALYERYAPGRYSLSDRGYLARVHPLELWLLAYLREHPQATQAQVLAASSAQRQEVYGWLMRTRFHQAQNTRILSLIESDAFAEIHRSWQRLGFPFDSLVPSYATAIGSSGDRPAALAELLGIIVGDGVRQPAVQLESLHFAAGTPYETLLRRQPGAGERVLAPEVAQTLRRAMMDVVEQGTARRLRGALLGPDGQPLAVGGKTGTGDNRLQAYGPRGVLIGSRVVNRTATFVFFVGDRHYGILTAFVLGEAAEGYRFTSALPVTIVKVLAPLLAPALAPGTEAACPVARPAVPLQEAEARPTSAR